MIVALSFSGAHARPEHACFAFFASERVLRFSVTVRSEQRCSTQIQGSNDLAT